MRELSAAARDYFAHPRQVIEGEPLGVTTVQAELPSGEILQLQLRVSPPDLIAEARFKAYGCAWLIACGSWLTERLTGRTLAEAEQFRHHELIEALTVPPEKLHCAVLAETVLQTALRSLT